MSWCGEPLGAMCTVFRAGSDVADPGAQEHAKKSMKKPQGGARRLHRGQRPPAHEGRRPLPPAQGCMRRWGGCAPRSARGRGLAARRARARASVRAGPRACVRPGSARRAARRGRRTPRPSVRRGLASARPSGARVGARRAQARCAARRAGRLLAPRRSAHPSDFAAPPRHEQSGHPLLPTGASHSPVDHPFPLASGLPLKLSNQRTPLKSCLFVFVLPSFACPTQPAEPRFWSSMFVLVCIQQSTAPCLVPRTYIYIYIYI